MNWDATKLGQRFAREADTRERELTALKRKAAGKDSYKSAHDRQLGAYQVYSRLSTSAELIGRASLERVLSTMRKEDPFESVEAFDRQYLKLGWDETLEKLLSEFSKDSES